MKLMRKKLVGYAFIAPWLVGFAALVFGPMIASLVLSFYHYNPGGAHFAGLANYAAMMRGDDDFWRSVVNTMLYTLFVVPLGLTGSLLLAVLLDQNLKLKGLWRTLFYIPTLAPAAASAFLWEYLFSPDAGLVNAVLSAVGLPRGRWFESPTMALPTMVLMSLWAIGGGRMIIFLAGLQGVPLSLREAAQLDGCSALRRFWHVTLPIISPLIFFNALLGIIGAFQVFTQAYLITKGGPDNATLFYALLLFKEAFQNFEIGKASAMAWCLFLLLAVITAVKFWTARFWVHYGD